VVALFPTVGRVIPAPPPGQAREIRDHLPHALGHAEGGDREVVALESKQRHPDEGGEERGDTTAEQQRNPEAEVPVTHRDGSEVAADPEEYDLAEGCVAGEAADEVPRLRQRDKHEDRRDGPFLTGVELALHSECHDHRQHSQPPRQQAPGLIAAPCGYF